MQQMEEMDPKMFVTDSIEGSNFGAKILTVLTWLCRSGTGKLIMIIEMGSEGNHSIVFNQIKKIDA